MPVVATAGHVDHGKSTLVRALTGMEPDRFAEERRRGMTIDLGYAWTTLPDGTQVSFVDVPGHQRFIANMLAGLGPAPAVLFVIAADQGWQPQSTDHLAALCALGIQNVLIAVTRCDRAEPDSAAQIAAARFAAAGLPDVPIVPVAALEGTGLDELRSRLIDLVGRQSQADPDAPVRFWVDRVFEITGSGTVATGTLSGGTLTLRNHLTMGDHTITVRAIQVCGSFLSGVGPVTRVALNLRGKHVASVSRGDALTAPDRFVLVHVIDVALSETQADRTTTRLMLHVGTAAVPVRVRPLAHGFARLSLSVPLPLRAGDRAVLRDPGRHSVAGGVVVLDVDPPELHRRGSARERADQLRRAGGVPSVQDEVRRRGAVQRVHLERIGIDTAGVDDVSGWLVSTQQWGAWVRGAPVALQRWAEAHPLEPGMPRKALHRELGMPDGALLDGVLADAGIDARRDRLTRATEGAGDHRPLAPIEAALATLADHFEVRPFVAPDAETLAALGLGHRELAAAVRAGRLLQLAPGIVLPAGAPAAANGVLAGLAQPFTLGEARVALGTTRRTAVPLLEHLDRQGITERDDSDRRYVKTTEGN